MVQSGLTAKGLLFDQCVDVTQAASLLIVVETITNDEVVGDTQCCILHVKRHGELARLEQQCADTDTVGLILLQFLHHVLHGAARIDDILHDNDVASLDISGQAYNFLDDARRFRRLIRLEANERDLARNSDAAHQVRGKDKRAIENGQKDGVFTL